jgi:stage V sporulation protein G
MIETKEQSEAFDCLAGTQVQLFPFKETSTMGHVKALAMVLLNDQIVIRGLRVMEGDNGLLVGYPLDPFFKGEELRSLVFPITRALREHIENCVLEKFLYETERADIKFTVELTHPELSGASIKMEIIAGDAAQAERRAIAKAVSFMPNTEANKGDWVILELTEVE